MKKCFECWGIGWPCLRRWWQRWNVERQLLLSEGLDGTGKCFCYVSRYADICSDGYLKMKVRCPTWALWRDQYHVRHLIGSSDGRRVAQWCFFAFWSPFVPHGLLWHCHYLHSIPTDGKVTEKNKVVKIWKRSWSHQNIISTSAGVWAEIRNKHILITNFQPYR